MKFWLIICCTFLFSLAANAARKPHEAKLTATVAGVNTPTLKVKKAFFAPVKNHPSNQQSETIHRDNCNRTVSQCRSNGNDNIISGHSLPLALIIYDRSQHACQVLPAFISTLSRLLLFPNHYFW